MAYFSKMNGLKAGLKKRSSVVAALLGRLLKCSDIPGRKKEKTGKREGRKGKKGKERRREKIRDRTSR